MVGKPAGSPERSRYQYRLLPKSDISTMQGELEEAANLGYEYKGQAFFDPGLAEPPGDVLILERDHESPPMKWEYRLLATKKTSTMQKEVGEAGREGFQFVNLMLGQRLTGNEVITILRRPRDGAKARASK